MSSGGNSQKTNGAAHSGKSAGAPFQNLGTSSLGGSQKFPGLLGDSSAAAPTAWSEGSPAEPTEAASPESRIVGAATASGQPTGAALSLVPAAVAGGDGTGWSSAKVVAGQKKNETAGVNWQGWYSQTYTDAWPAPTLVYDGAAAASGALFGWLLVPWEHGKAADASMSIEGGSTGSLVRASVTIGHRTENVTMDLGAPP